MSKLSPREAVKIYQVSRATLMKALSEGTISAEKTDAGHWRVDTSELARVYTPRPKGDLRDISVNRPKPNQMNQIEPAPKTDVDQEIAVRLALAEAALDAEREKNALLQRHLDDVRLMLPSPGAKSRRRWWPW